MTGYIGRMATAQAKSSSTGRAARSANAAVAGARAAAHSVVENDSLVVVLPVLGRVVLPPPEHLAWYAGVGVLAVLEVVDWPIAVVLAVGRVLADNRHNRTLEQFGEALDEAG